MTPRPRTKCPKDGRAYRQLWRIVDGAVADAFAAHPDYLTPKGRRSAQLSVTKRVTGAVLGFAAEAARAGRVLNPAADKGAEVHLPSPAVAWPTGHRKRSTLGVVGRYLFAWWRP